MKNGPLWDSKWNLHSVWRRGIIKDNPEEAWKIEKKLFIPFIKLVSMWYFFLKSWESFTYFMYLTKIHYRLWILVKKRVAKISTHILFLEIYSGCRHKLTLFLRQTRTLAVLNLCTPGCPQTHREPLSFVSLVLRLMVCPHHFRCNCCTNNDKYQTDIWGYYPHDQHKKAWYSFSWVINSL